MATVKRKKKPSCKNVVIGDGLRTKEESAPVETFPVQSVRYSVHTKQGAKPDHPKTLRVDYTLGGVFDRPVSEWVCVEHKGFARKNGGMAGSPVTRKGNFTIARFTRTRRRKSPGSEDYARPWRCASPKDLRGSRPSSDMNSGDL